MQGRRDTQVSSLNKHEIRVELTTSSVRNCWTVSSGPVSAVIPTDQVTYWTSRVRPINRPAIEHDRRYTNIVISEQVHVLTGYSQLIRTLSTNYLN